MRVVVHWHWSAQAVQYAGLLRVSGNVADRAALAVDQCRLAANVVHAIAVQTFVVRIAGRAVVALDHTVPCGIAVVIRHTVRIAAEAERPAGRGTTDKRETWRGLLLSRTCPCAVAISCQRLYAIAAACRKTHPCRICARPRVDPVTRPFASAASSASRAIPMRCTKHRCAGPF